jgi:L-arabinose isomerase
MGQRFRMVAAEIDVVPALEPLPKLPVARAVWRPRPDLRTAAAAWIHAGGSHHTALGFSVTRDHLRDFAAMTGVELLMIDADTTVDTFRDQLRWNDLYWLLAKGL